MNVIITSISFCEYTIQQANGLAGLGHQVLLILPNTLVEITVGSDLNKLLASGVEFYGYEITGRGSWRFYKELFERVTKYAPDIIHIHDNGEMETLALIFKFNKVPLVVTVHDVTTHPGADSQIKNRRRIVRKLLRSRAEVIHLHGDSLKSKLELISPKLAKKSVVIPHGALSLFKNWENGQVEREPMTCLFFGRMERYRGLDNLLETGRLLKEMLPDIRIVVAGRGSELSLYKTAMAELGIFEIHDEFIPNKDVHRFFRRSSLVLLPYHEASQSGVVTMGIPFGVPVVATAVGSIPEILINGIHGRIVPVGDIKRFAEAIRDLLIDRNKIILMSRACEQLAERLSFRKLAADYESLYDRAVLMKKTKGFV